MGSLAAIKVEPMPTLSQARQTAGGKIVRLAQGTTYYELAGPVSAPTVVLIHGFSVPSYVWDPTTAGLRQAGLRVLRYDLYGRGLSDRPGVRYTRALFIAQLAELLDALDIGGPAHLVGLSMGGPIAAGFSAEHPAKVASLALLAPAGLMDELSVSIRALRFFHMIRPLASYAKHRQRATAPTYAQSDHSTRADYISRYRQQMRWPGFRRAILSTLRHGPLRSQHQVYAQVSRLGMPTLLIWGEQDQMVPFVLHETLQDLMPDAVFHAIPKAGHAVHFEQHELVNPLLIEHIHKHSPGGLA